MQVMVMGRPEASTSTCTDRHHHDPGGLILKCFLKEAGGRPPAVIFAITLHAHLDLAGFVGLINRASPWCSPSVSSAPPSSCAIFFLVINIVKTRYLFHNLVILMLVCATLVAFSAWCSSPGAVRTEWIAEHVLKKIGYGRRQLRRGARQAYRINSTFLPPTSSGNCLRVALLVSLLSMAWRAGANGRGGYS